MKVARYFVDSDDAPLSRAADELAWMSATDFTLERRTATREAGIAGHLMLWLVESVGGLAFLMPAISNGAESSGPDASTLSDTARPAAVATAAATSLPSSALVAVGASASMTAPAEPITVHATASISLPASVGSTSAVPIEPPPAAVAATPASASTAAAGSAAGPSSAPLAVPIPQPAPHTANNAALRALKDGLSLIRSAAGFSNLDDLCDEFASILDCAAVIVRNFLIAKATSEGVAGLSASTSNAELSATLLTTPVRAKRWVALLANSIVACEWHPLMRVLEGSSDPAAAAAQMVLVHPAISAVSTPTHPMRAELGNTLKRLLIPYMALTPEDA